MQYDSVNRYRRFLKAGLFWLACLGSLHAVAGHVALVSSPPVKQPAHRVIPVSDAGEIAEAMKTAAPGDTLLMQDKVWRDQQVVFEGTGTAALPIVLRAETPGRVILSGTSVLQIAGRYLVADGLVFKNGHAAHSDVVEFRHGKKEADYCRLTNTVIDAYNPPGDTTDYKWVSLYGLHNRVDHCLLKGKDHQGPTLVIWLDGRPDYHRIDHNYFGHRPELGRNGGETIRIGTSTWSKTDSYTRVEDNYFEACDGETEIISSKSGHNTIQHNTFYECSGTVTLRHGNYDTVRANFFFGGHKPGTGGIRVIGEGQVVVNNYLQDLDPRSDIRAPLSVMNAQEHPKLTGYWQVKDAVIAHNTIVHCTAGIVIGSGADENRVLPPQNCYIFNNLIWNGKGLLIRYKDQPVRFTWRGNIVYGASGTSDITGVERADPRFRYDMKGDNLWRPAPDSPVRDHGASVPVLVIKEDMDGQPRKDGKPDAGADERSDAPVRIIRPGPGNTGPLWMKR